MDPFHCNYIDSMDVPEHVVARLRVIDRRLGGRLVLIEKKPDTWDAYVSTTGTLPEVSGVTAIEAAERLLALVERSPWLGTVAA